MSFNSSLLFKKEDGWIVRANVRFLESLEGAPIRANAYGGLYSSLERTRIAASERSYRNADLSDEWVVSAARIGWRYLFALQYPQRLKFRFEP